MGLNIIETDRNQNQGTQNTSDRNRINIIESEPITTNFQKVTTNKVQGQVENLDMVNPFAKQNDIKAQGKILDMTNPFAKKNDSQHIQNSHVHYQNKMLVDRSFPKTQPLSKPSQQNGQEIQKVETSRIIDHKRVPQQPTRIIEQPRVPQQPTRITEQPKRAEERVITESTIKPRVEYYAQSSGLRYSIRKNGDRREYKISRNSELFGRNGKLENVNNPELDSLLKKSERIINNKDGYEVYRLGDRNVTQSSRFI
jgi:hypothetical protein